MFCCKGIIDVSGAGYMKLYTLILRMTSHWEHGNDRKYIKQPHHCKKELSEKDMVKRERRKYKGITKDNAKSDDCRSASPWVQRYCHKRHRSWVRENIHRENWEALTDQRRYRLRR